MLLDYVELGDAGNTGSFTGELGRAIARHGVDRIVVTQQAEQFLARLESRYK